MKFLNQKTQYGFSILGIILVIVAVIIAISVWALSGQTNSDNKNKADIQATAIINDGNAMLLEMNKLLIQGNSLNSIVFIPNIASTPIAPNILDPVNGIQLPKVNTSVIKDGKSAPYGMWIYHNFFRIVGYGGIMSRHKALVLAGVKDSVCERINLNINGSSDIPYRPAGVSINNLFSDVTVENPTTNIELLLGTSLPINVRLWTNGCIKTDNTVTDENIYFIRYVYLK